MAIIAAVLPSPVSLQIFLLILCGSCWWVINGREPQREFDYFKLALQWPPTICQRTRYCCSSNACCRGANSPSEFTIHGLWPDYNDGTWPGCCDGHVFDQKAISVLDDEMIKYWPSLSCHSPSNCHGGEGSFWAHEWEKHGTCSFPVFRDELSYFSTALSLYSSHNVTQILDDAGYVPSNSEKYPLGGIITTIKNAFRATPSLECSNGAVKELHLCFHKDFEPRDCEIGSSFGGNTMVSSRSCPDYIHLPVNAPSGFDQIDVEDPLAFAEI